MVNISKSGNAIKFTFTDSDHYLYGNGEVEVPVNSLSLVVDESKFVVFKKAATNDTFITFDPANSNLSDKAGVIEFYKTNMVGSSGGGSESGVTSGDVETMIDTALDDYYDKNEVDAGFDSVNATLSGKADTAVVNQAISEVTQSILSVSGDVYTYSAATEARLDEDEQVTAAALNNLDENKQDALQYYSEDTENKSAEILITNDDGEGSTGDNHFNIGGGVAEIGIYNEYDDGQGNVTSNNSFIYADQTMVNLQAGVTENGDTTSTDLSVESTGVTINGDAVATEPYVDAAISGKVDTSAITTAITSGSTDAEIPTAKATYDAIQAGGGGGATYSAGTNISIDTANTINCTLPITASTYGGLVVSMKNNSASTRAFAGGEGCNASSTDSFAYGIANTASSTGSTAFGFKTNASVYGSFVCGKWNDIANANTGENFGSSGNTVFAVGNGWKENDWTSGNATKHNALDIRQNGDIYFPDTDNTTYQNFYEKPMVRLQDMYGALGGLKFVSLSQSEYDNLATKDSSTLYIINNVVS